MIHLSKKFFYLSCTLFFLASQPIWAKTESLEKRVSVEKRVLVSVAPYVSIVGKIAGPEITIDLIVPPGASSHTFEPTPKQILQESKAQVWFCIGEPFEEKARLAFQKQNPQMRLIDLRKELPLLTHTHCHAASHSCASDPHIWMSPKLVEKQVPAIAQALIETFPDLRENIQENANKMIEELQALDQEIQKILHNAKGSTIFVSHPAYGYFCKEYDVKQVSIEFEGKDPTPKELTSLLQKAKDLDIHTIFIQKQYSSKGAKAVAQQIGAHLVILDPYSEDYFSSMKEIATAFAKRSE